MAVQLFEPAGAYSTVVRYTPGGLWTMTGMTTVPRTTSGTSTSGNTEFATVAATEAEVVS